MKKNFQIEQLATVLLLLNELIAIDC